MVVYNNVLAGAAGQTGGADALTLEKSVRFNSDDSPYLNRTPSSAGNRKTFTLSGWIKRSSFGVQRGVFSTYAGTHPTTALVFSANDEFWFFDYNTSYNFQLKTSAVFRDPSAWLHFVIAVDTTQATASNRVKIYINGEQVTDFGTSTYPSQDFELDWNSATEHNIGKHSRNFNGYFADFYFIDGQAKEATDFGAFDDNGVWQAAAYSGTFGTNGFHLFDFANESGIGNDSSGNDNDWTVNNITSDESVTGVSRVWSSGDSDWTITGSGQYASKSSTSSYADVFTNLLSPGTLYGFTVNIPDGDDNGGWFLGDSNSTSLSGTHPNQGRGSNSIGQRGRSSSPDNDSLGVHGTFATANSVTAGDSALTGFQSINPYGATEIDFVVDRVNNKCWVKLASNSSWIKGGDPTNPSSTPSFHLPSTGDMYFGFIQYDDQTNLEITQFSVSQTPSNPDVLYDVPTNGSSDDDTGAGGELSSNYCTWNPLDKATVTLANGNLDITAASTDHCVRGTIAVPESVKIYYEFTVTQRGGGGAQSPIVGVANTSFDLDTNPDAQTSTVWSYSGSGSKLGGGSGYTSYGSSLSADDVLGVAIDRSAGRIWFSLNGTWQNSGDPTDSTDSNAAFTNVPTTGTLFIFFGNNNGTPGLGTLNAGQHAFAYSAPTDYKTLCTTNLPTPTIADGSDYFDVKLYDGNGSTNAITGLEFSPDLVWLKSRSAAKAHCVFDTVRDVNNRLLTNTTDEEYTVANTLTSFDDNGFTLGSNNEANGSGNTHVAWAWDAGSSTVSNTDGSITASVRANQTAGFSIVSFTGTNANGTVGHGLNTKPSLYIVKNRDTAANWFAFTDLIDGSNDYLYLNTTGSKNDAGLNYANVATSSVFYMGVESGGLNTSGDEHIAYCFAPVAGYSAFGSYEGNGSSDGPFVHTNFRPALVIYKNADTAYGWQIYDSTRDPDNVCDSRLSPSSSNAEDTTVGLDMLSNGFKIRTDHARTNNSGDTFIYAAFAENPFQANGGLAR